MRGNLKGAVIGVLIGSIGFLIYAAITDQLHASTQITPIFITLILAGGAAGTTVAFLVDRAWERGYRR